MTDWTAISELEARCREGGPEALITGLGAALDDASEPTRSTLTALRAAVQADQGFLTKHPQALFQSLYNRLYWHAAGEPSSPLVQMVEAWRAEHSGAWLRSRRPLPRPLFEAACEQVFRTAEGLGAVSFSADGRRLAAGGGEHAYVWDVASGERLATLGELEGEVLSVAFDPTNPDRVATGSRDHTAAVWDLSARSIVWISGGQEGRVTSVAFSPDGKWLLAGNLGWTARCFDAETAEVRTVFEGHEQSVLSVAWHPDGAQVATAASDGTARIWDVAGGDCLHVFSDPACEASLDVVQHVAFSPDGSRFACDLAGDLRVWETAGWEQVAVLQSGDRTSKRRLAFLDDERLALVGWDRVRVWRVSDGELLLELEIEPRSLGEAAALHGERFAVAEQGGLVRVRPLERGDVSGPAPAILEREQELKQVIAAPEGSEVWACLRTYPERLVRLSEEAGPGDEGWTIEPRLLSPGLTVDGGGRWLVYASAPEGVYDSKSFLQVFDLEAGSPTRRLEAPGVSPDTEPKPSYSGYSAKLAFAPGSGGLLAWGDADGVIELWQAGSGTRFRPLVGHAGEVSQVVFAAGGRRLISVARGASYADPNELRVWDVVSGRCWIQAQVRGFKERGSVSVDPSGEQAATSKDGVITVWGPDGKARATFTIDVDDERRSPETGALALAGDRLVAAVYDGTVRCWSVEQSALLWTHAGNVVFESLALAGDGVIATGEAAAVRLGPDGEEVWRQAGRAAASAVVGRRAHWVRVTGSDTALAPRGEGEAIAWWPTPLSDSKLMPGNQLVGQEPGDVALLTLENVPTDKAALPVAAPLPEHVAPVKGSKGLILPPGARHPSAGDRPKGFQRF